MSNIVDAKKEKRYSRVPKFIPRQMDKLFLKDQAESVLTESKPTVDADKNATLHCDAEEGKLSKDERIYLKWEEEKCDCILSNRGELRRTRWSNDCDTRQPRKRLCKRTIWGADEEVSSPEYMDLNKH